ncbi:MAG: hypothetical protein ACOYIG_00300 [Acetivibrionales bacterium]|jgi:hypothetical protein
MSQYTELLDIKAETLSPDDDEYEMNLLEVSALFRGFDEALTAFIEEHGFIGDLTDIKAKAEFLREKFKTANVKPPRDFKEWFIPNKKFSRKTAYQICFAFGLGVDETNDFFRCVQFERGFDCHAINEVVYYFCMKNGLSYTVAQEIIDQIPVPKKAKAIPNREILYTGTIIEYINSIDDKEKLIQYIKDNINDFQYNNATAIKYIQELWDDISKTGGLAASEGAIIDRTYNRFEDKHKKHITDTRSKEVVKEEVLYQEQEVKPFDYVVAGSDASTWIIFSQILGLSNYQENDYSSKYDRSLTSVLSENKLMPLKADYCFPSRQSIDKLMRGELVGDDEIIRKMLIFLVFYTYWAKIVVSKKDAFYTAKVSDTERCLDTINARLLDAGYPELYAGNPYDWLFKWSLNDEHPLEAFRTYMGEVFAIKEGNTDV